MFDGDNGEVSMKNSCIAYFERTGHSRQLAQDTGSKLRAGGLEIDYAANLSQKTP